MITTFSSDESSIQLAIGLFEGYLPENTKLLIELTDGHLIHKYILRVKYTSPSSGRSMCMTAKGDSLPTSHDSLFTFYLRQLVLTKAEVRREFSRLYFYERRAKQDEFLFGNKNVRVSGKTNRIDEDDGAVIQDTLSYENYI